MSGHTFPLIEVRGGAYELGRQHGEQAAPLIERYLLLIERITGKSRDTLCAGALCFLPRLMALDERLVQEVRGLADGAGITFAEALVCQVRGEAAFAAAAGEGCTAFALRGAATADGAVLAGQNQDMPPEFGEVSILLRVIPDDGRPRALMYTFAGQIGYFGMNSLGVANFANSVYDFQWQPGLAHYPLKRAAMQCETVDEVVELYREHPQCSAANTVLCDGRGAITSMESRPEGVALYAGDHPDAIVHTNHYLSAAFKHHETGSLPDSFTRHARMTALVRERWGAITVETLKGFLADHAGDPAAICRHGERGMHSTSGHIAEPAKGLLHVRRGHGCLGTWETYHV
jgi:isopenicillin-N N-acyltransferase-like protein